MNRSEVFYNTKCGHILTWTLICRQSLCSEIGDDQKQAETWIRFAALFLFLFLLFFIT